MCEAPSTWRARMWRMESRAFSAEYSGLIAAPGTPKAQGTPSFSRIRTAASMARIFGMGRSSWLSWAIVVTCEGRSQCGGFYFPRDGTDDEFACIVKRLQDRSVWDRHSGAMRQHRT